MFELEVNHTVYRKTQLSPEIQEAFVNHTPNYAAVSVLQWEEHCTECAMPQCYKTCDLYEPRNDGKCRRFTEGISPIKGFPDMLNDPVKISFKKWGGLMATGYLDIVDYKKAMLFEQKTAKVAGIACSIPDSKLSILGRRGITSRLTTRYKKKLLANFLDHEKLVISPDYFLLEIYNPNEYDIDLTFMIRATEGEQNATPFQKRLELGQGFHRITVDFIEIQAHIAKNSEHYVSIVPNQKDDGQAEISVYFGFLGFVKDNEYIPPEKKSIKDVKLVAWDLDNTVWKGTLIEDGPEKLELVPGIKSIMQTLDKRGIINTVISKNNHDEALDQLKKFDLADLVVFPQINWNPKSQSLKEIVREFNIGKDTIAFIDDSPFERSEVESVHPELRIFDASEYMNLLGYPGFNPNQSTESSMRRGFYQSQINRNQGEEDFHGEYLEFIQSCEIRLNIIRAIPDNSDRIQELVQRTNQMNFSGNRYQRQSIEELIHAPEFDKYTLKCEDRFGNYGTVGFCVVDNRKPQLIDLMFSCRIQSKRIEHAFISWLLHHYHTLNFDIMYAKYKKTPKNTPAGKVFKDSGFIEVQNDNNNILYEFDLSGIIPWDGLIEIEYEGKQWAP